MSQANSPSPPLPPLPPRRHRPFRGALLRGLGVLLPPLLTIVILLWIWHTVKSYALQPVTAATRDVLAWSLEDARDELPGAKPTDQDDVYRWNGADWRKLDDGQFVPQPVYAVASRGLDTLPPHSTGYDVYKRYVEAKYLRPVFVVPVFLVLFVVAMYLLGSLFAAGVGLVFWENFEQLITQVPLVRSVYGSAKQVTDYLISEKPLEFKRVVAFEHPAKGMWQIAFVASEGPRELRELVGEPMFALLVHVNPVPVSGYIRIVPKSQVFDLDMTVDQAVHYIVSFGVVLPEQQLPRDMTKTI